MMKKFNEVTLNITVAIIDFLYQGRDYQRFWVLEEIARAPYFAFLSVLHLRESMGLRGPEHIYLMEEHFAQTLNETEHLEYMESRGGSAYWVDRAFARHLVLIYYWVNVVYYWLAPRSAYHLSYEIELHAEDTYAKYLKYEDRNDKDIERIMLDEKHHAQELKEAMEMIK
jgi:hypothetical protein